MSEMNLTVYMCANCGEVALATTCGTDCLFLLQGTLMLSARMARYTVCLGFIVR